MIRKTKYVYRVFPGNFEEYSLEDAKRRALKVCANPKLDNCWIDVYEVGGRGKAIISYYRVDSSNGRMRWDKMIN